MTCWLGQGKQAREERQMGHIGGEKNIEKVGHCEEKENRKEKVGLGRQGFVPGEFGFMQNIFYFFFQLLFESNSNSI
jgi:hypothetical protein